MLTTLNASTLFKSENYKMAALTRVPKAMFNFQVIYMHHENMPI